MASIRARARKDGTESFTLMWREGGEQRGHVFDNKAEAERWKMLLDANGQSMAQANQVWEESNQEGPTVAEAIQQHIEQLVDVTPYTLKRYRDALRLYFHGPLGSMKVARVQHGDIVDWIKWMQARGLGPKTISDKHGFLSAAMLTQTRNGTIPRNPCAGVRLPKKRRVGDDGDDINLDDYKAIRDRMDPHFVPFLEFLVGSGCRFSEATALTGKDFNLSGTPPLAFITKAHKLGGDENPARYIGEPKSDAGRRRVSLAPSTVAAVAPLVQKALEEGGPVFRMKGGGPMDHQSFYNRAWSKPRKAAGLGPGSGKHVTVHSIRHLHAAIMLHAGMNLYELSRRMGHSSIQVTADKYGHLVPDAHFRGAEHAAKALEESPPADPLTA